MPRVLVPLLTLKPESASGCAFARNLVPALGRVLGADELVVLGTPFVRELLADHAGPFELRRVGQGRPARLLATRWLVPAAARRHGAQRIYVPDGQLVPAPGLPPTVIALHHHLNLSRPEGQPLAQRLYWKLWYDRALRRSCRTALALTCPSRAFAREFAELVPESEGRLQVVPHGVSEEFSPVPAAGERPQPAAKPYVLVVGNPSPYKNVAGALAAFARAVEGRESARLELWVAGLDGRELQELAVAEGLGALVPRLRALGRVKQQELPPLYRGASALLFPSRVESFGLPVLEGMACGTPVLCSDLPALRELVGEACLMEGPEDHAGLGAALARLLDDRGLRERLRERGLRRARELSWELAAERTAALLALEPGAPSEPMAAGAAGEPGASG